MRHRVLLLCAFSLVAALLPMQPAVAVSAVIHAPVQMTEGTRLTSNYGVCRAGCARTHRGEDIMARQMTEVYATENGYIRRAYGGNSRACLNRAYCTNYGLLLYGDDGNSYFYLHLNDDTPGRPAGCDHRGGAESAFSPRLVDVLRGRGTLEPVGGNVVRVRKGELIGYVGSSGNAGCRVDHIHFEMWGGHMQLRADDARKVDPYPYIRAALDAGRFWGPDGSAPSPEPHGRVAGDNRIQTAVRLSEAAFGSAPAVVLAPANVPTEALVAAPLAAALGGPTLLTWPRPDADGKVLPDVTANEIRRLGASSVVVVGDPSRLDPALEQELIDVVGVAPDAIRRVGSPDIYELSRLVADEVIAARGGGAPSPILALGDHPSPSRSWPDALAATIVAARDKAPILLTAPDHLPGPTADFLQRLGDVRVRVVGGTAAIPTHVESAVHGLGNPTKRLQGATRYDTALRLAEEAERRGANSRTVFVATGRNYPDALAAGAAVARLGRTMVLVNGRGTAAEPVVEHWLRYRAGTVGRVDAIGGPSAVRDPVLRDAAVAANWPL